MCVCVCVCVCVWERNMLLIEQKIKHNKLIQRYWARRFVSIDTWDTVCVYKDTWESLIVCMGTSVCPLDTWEDIFVFIVSWTESSPVSVWTHRRHQCSPESPLLSVPTTLSPLDLWESVIVSAWTHGSPLVSHCLFVDRSSLSVYDTRESIIVYTWTNVSPFDLWESNMLYLGHLSVHWGPRSPILSLCGHLKVHYWRLCRSLLQSLCGHINVRYCLH